LNRPEVIALDLEGTLISNAVSQIARPGLLEFLDFCQAVVPRIVMYTSVYEVKFRDISKMLADERLVPEWFKTIEYVNWTGRHKDLTAIPSARVGRTVLIDDYEGYVLPEQKERWIPIRSYSAPYAEHDAELRRVREVLECKWDCHVG
jgi:hypothetical protein